MTASPLRSAALPALLLLLVARSAATGPLERETEARWAGRWVLAAVELEGRCAPGALAQASWSGAPPASRVDLQAGELARVTHVDVDRARVQLRLVLPEPVLTSFRDGPFTLSEHRRCTVSLDVPVPRRVVKSKDADALDEFLLRWIEPHRSRSAAEAAPAFRPRPFEPLPDQTELLADHAAWKEERRLQALRSRARDEVRWASRLLERVDDHPDYALGFAAGIEHVSREARSQGSGLDCDRLLRQEAGRAGHRVGPASGLSDEYGKGFEDGHRLAWSLLAAEVLLGCADAT